MPIKLHRTRPLSAAAAPAPLGPPTGGPGAPRVARALLRKGGRLGAQNGALFGAIYAPLVILAWSLWLLLSDPWPSSLEQIRLLLVPLPVMAQIGAGIGALLGVSLGALSGLVVAALSRLSFAHFGGWQSYRDSAGLLCVGVTALPLLLLAQALGQPLIALLHNITWFVPILQGSALLAGLLFWRLGGNLAAWYAKQSGQYHLPILLADPEPPDHYDRRVQHLLLDTSPRRYRRAMRVLWLGQDPRERLLALMDLSPGMRVCDLLAGNRQQWPAILDRIGPAGRLVVVGHPPPEHAADPQIEWVAGDALLTGLPDGSVDALLCSFRAALVPPIHLSALADSIHRALGPNGLVGLAEFPQPQGRLSRLARGGYLRLGAPLLSLAQLTEPRYTRLVAEQTALRGSAAFLAQTFAARGFEIHCYRVPGSGAAVLVGMKL